MRDLAIEKVSGLSALGALWTREPLPDYPGLDGDLVLYYENNLSNFFVTDTLTESRLWEAGDSSRSGLVPDFQRKLNKLAALRSRSEPEEDESWRDCTTSLNFEVTNGCNLRCPHCYLGGTSGTRLSFSHFVRVLVQAASRNIRHIVLTGGEPFLHPKLIQMVHAALECRLAVNILTNGTAITKRKQRELVELQRAYSPRFQRCRYCECEVAPEMHQCPACAALVHPILFQVSLDGANATTHDGIRGTGSFKKAIDTIRFLNEAGFPVALSKTVMRQNKDEPEEYLELAASLDIRRLRVGYLDIYNKQILSSQIFVPPRELLNYYIRLTNYVDSIASTRPPHEHFRVGEIIAFRGAIANLIKRNSCYHCKASHVSASGEMSLCPLCPDPSFRLGDLARERLDEAFRRKVECGRQTRSFLTNLHGCSHCLFKDVCGGGCRANAKSVSGKLYGMDPYCSFYKGFFRYLIGTLSRFPNSPRNFCLSGLQNA